MITAMIISEVIIQELRKPRRLQDWDNNNLKSLQLLTQEELLEKLNFNI